MHCLIITMLGLQTHRHFENIWAVLKNKKIKGDVGRMGHIVWDLGKPCFIESWNYSQTGTENISLLFPLLGKYASSQKQELKHKDKWTPSCQEKPAALGLCLLGPALPLQLLQLPKREMSTQAQLPVNGGTRLQFPYLCSTSPKRGIIGTWIEACARSFCIRRLLSLKIKRSYW